VISGVGLPGGGWGAKHNGDGMSGVVCINDGDTHNSPTEQLESKYPVMVERYGLRPDSGGAGRNRGGLGTEMVVQALAAFSLTTRIDRVHCRPWGLHGGSDAAGNAIGIRSDGEWNTDFPNAKVFSVRLRKGDAYIMQSGGGGGFGPAIERDPEQVARDVRLGYVTRSAAQDDYGVVLLTDGSVDVPATAARRRELAHARPAVPAAESGRYQELDFIPG
jgi:N-methylhydantoinase B